MIKGGVKNLKKIVLISSGQPSLNPRLVKEADALADNDYAVTVLYSYWNEWGTAFDKILLPTKKWRAVCIGGDPEQKPVVYFLSRLIHKVARAINQKTGGKALINLAISRPSCFLIQAAKKYKADFYIGHNLGALPATVKTAKANKKQCGFDAEDFHRNEVSDDKRDPDVVLKTNIENRYFSRLDYLSASSPLIASAYHKLFPDKEPEILLNVFPSSAKISHPVLNNSKPVRLFWFSQTIGPRRGLEEAIASLAILKEYSFELHLLGHITADNRATFANDFITANQVSVHFHDPVAPDEIIPFASQFDIGLAIETGVPLNRDICLTNKIFNYLQSGLCVIASDTAAQLQLIDQYPTVGKIYKKADPHSLADVLLYYYRNREKLFEARKAALAIAQEQLNWENESKKFLKLVEQTLNHGN